MVFAEKLIKLRKQNGWSQEDLTMPMDVLCQSVSKREIMVSILELDKIVKLRCSMCYYESDETLEHSIARSPY